MSQTKLGPYRLGSLVRHTPLGPLYEGVAPNGDGVDVLLVSRPKSVSDEEWVQALAAFDAQTERVAALEHPNIIRPFGAGTEGQLHYIVMEKIRGETLAQKIASEGTPVLARVAPRFAQLCDAIACAHAQGVVHGALSPDLVLITQDGSVKVSHFGGSLLRRPNPRYTAPEVLRGASPDVQSDLFSLGAIFYEMLAARSAFPGITETQVRKAILSNCVPAPLPEHPPHVQGILLKTLAFAREERYQNAREILADLRGKRVPEGYERAVVVATPGHEQDMQPLDWQPLPGSEKAISPPLQAAVNAAQRIGRRSPTQRLRAASGWTRRAAGVLGVILPLLAVAHAGDVVRRANTLEVLRVHGSASSCRFATETPRALGKGGLIGVGDTVRTGPETTLLVGATDGTHWRIGPDTRIVVTALSFQPQSRKRERIFYLQKGRVAVRATPQPKSSLLAVVTPQARVVVTGTLFTVEAIDGKATRIAVLEGTTQVTARQGQATVPAGRGTEVTHAGIIRPPAGLSQSRVKELLQSVAELKSVDGRFGTVRRVLRNLEDRTLVVLAGAVLQALERTRGLAPGGEKEEAAALARATAAMTAICSALEASAAEGEYPETLDLRTLAELGLGEQNAKALLANFDGERLQSYVRKDDTYLFTARARDKAGTLLKATEGRVSQVTQSGGEENKLHE